MTDEHPVFSGTPTYGIPDYNYHDYILAHDHTGYALAEVGSDSFELTTPYATAHITIWDEEIVEFSITNTATGQNVYYLHFPLNDQARAEALFDELVAALLEQQSHRNVNVLLSCTSGWTTTLFANKLNRAAKALGLSYSFEAVPAGDLYEQGMAHDVVLLAPQLSYLYERARDVLNEKPVILIPTHLFATEDVTGCINLVREALADKGHNHEKDDADAPADARCACDIPLRVLSVLMRQTAYQMELAWQVTYGGRVLRENSMIKRGSVHKLLYGGKQENSRPHVTRDDLADLIASVLRTEPAGTKPDAIAIAMIGAVYQGVVRLNGSDFGGVNLEEDIQGRFGIPTVVANNVNAAALGWYNQQDTYQTIVFHSQSRGLVVGGQGLIIDGHLHEGMRSLAGEIQFFLPELPSPDAQLWTYQHRVWDPDRIARMLGQVFAADVGTIAPEAICVRSLLTPDMGPIRDEMLKYLPEEAMPKLIYIPHFTPYVYAGLLTMAQQRVRGVSKGGRS